MAVVILVSSGVFPGVAAAIIDVHNIEFFKGRGRFSGQTPPNSGFFVELCLFATDVTSAEVVPPGQSACPMDDFVSENERCCEQNFDTQNELDAAFPTGPGQSYTVNIIGVGEPDTAVIVYDLDAPIAYTEITSPASGAIIDTDQPLTVTWVLTGCDGGVPSACADGIALFVSPTMGVDEEVFEDDGIGIDETSRVIPSMTLEPNTEYRIEVETFRAEVDTGMTDTLGDPYDLLLVYEDINSIVVPEPTSLWSQAVALAWLGSVAWNRRRR